MILLASEFFIPLRLLGSFFHIAMNGMSASDKIFRILDMAEEADGTQSLTDGPISVGHFLRTVHTCYPFLFSAPAFALV